MNNLNRPRQGPFQRRNNPYGMSNQNRAPRGINLFSPRTPPQNFNRQQLNQIPNNRYNVQPNDRLSMNNSRYRQNSNPNPSKSKTSLFNYVGKIIGGLQKLNLGINLYQQFKNQSNPSQDSTLENISDDSSKT